ncbi:MAG: pilus assembly protein MshP [Methylophaga sp.]|nr:MAG: pilus assembly protein MshP [Methylophaga sp.]
MNNQSGITLIGAIFVLVIVSLLGQYLVNIASVQQRTTVLALQSARAYQTANAGIEWGISRIINNGGSCVTNTILSPNINNFTVTVSCQLLGSYSEDTITQNVYQITAKSEFSSYGNPDYISRTMQTTIHD